MKIAHQIRDLKQKIEKENVKEAIQKWEHGWDMGGYGEPLSRWHLSWKPQPDQCLFSSNECSMSSMSSMSKKVYRRG